MDAAGLDVVGKIGAAVISFIGGLVVGVWTVSAKMHQLQDHEKRLSRLEHCIEQKLDRLHERIDDLMVMGGMDPNRVRRNRRHDEPEDGEPKKRDYYG